MIIKHLDLQGKRLSPENLTSRFRAFGTVYRFGIEGLQALEFSRSLNPKT